MSVQEVEGGNEELMSILLLVASKVMSMGPNHVEKLMRRKWCFVSRVELLKELCNLAHNALILLSGKAKVSI